MKCLHAHVGDALVRGRAVNAIGHVVLEKLERDGVETDGTAECWRACAEPPSRVTRVDAVRDGVDSEKSHFYLQKGWPMACATEVRFFLCASSPHTRSQPCPPFSSRMAKSACRRSGSESRHACAS